MLGKVKFTSPRLRTKSMYVYNLNENKEIGIYDM